jgi:hypothetical protein
MEGQYFVYRHIRLDKNVPFYIGIGTKPKNYGCYTAEYKRAFVKNRRSEHWKNVVDKTDHRVEILFESDNQEEVKHKEIEFIALYGRKIDGGTLVNNTIGGDGLNGFTASREQILKRNKAIKDAYKKEDAKTNLSKAVKKVWDREGYRQNQSKSRTGLKRSPEAKANLTEARRKNCKQVKDLLTNRIYRSLADACEHLGLERPKEKNKLNNKSPYGRFVYLEDYDKIQREFTDN